MNKKAIITGGAGLIGRELCKTLIKEGWELASFDTEECGLKGAISVDCNIRDEVSVLSAFENLGWKSLDLLVNNAAKTPDFKKGLTELSLSEWNAYIETNLTGAFLMAKEAAKIMKSGGSIINIASTRAYMSEPKDFPYAVTKGAIISLTNALAVSLGPDIRVNAIAPGWISDDKDLRKIDHQQHPAGQVGRPGDIAEAMQYLLGAKFVTGETLIVDGGMTKKMIYAD